ncbi:MAG: hemerythrin domain-containing protein [Pseudomonadota bacterium]|nr:MAG: hemerythrin [Pseudomonadota bacterium]
MLTSIGRTSKPAGDLVDHLSECHERIRTFVRIAETTGRRADLDDASVVDACSRCERYFTIALPLHVADEEKSILPRLLDAAAGFSPEVHQALRTMEREHAEHEPLVRALLEHLALVQAAPAHQEHRAALARTAAELRAAFGEHLSLEERVVFPAIRRLEPAVQERIHEEMRERRR